MGAVMILAAAAPAAARATLAANPVPYMGVDTWYAFGPNVDQTVAVRLTNEVVSRALRGAGYRYVWIDAGWWQGTRNSRGRIVASHRQWPRGMAWIASYIHSRGLLAGIYTDAGTSGCANAGSYGHYRGDVDTFARWGFDAVKVDFCGGHKMRLNPRSAYRAFALAIRDDRPRRPILFAICNGARPGERMDNDPTYAESAYDSYSFGPGIADSWRTGPDLGWPGYVPFTAVVRNIALDARHPEAAGHGHWNDPDYLAPGQGMTPSEERAQFTMWAMLAGPLMLSADIAKLPAGTVRMLRNRQAIQIDQDPLGVQARRAHAGRRVSVWIKPLVGGAVAVAFLNHSARSAPAKLTRWMLNVKRGKRLLVENVWEHSTERAAEPIHVVVPADGMVLLRVSAG